MREMATKRKNDLFLIWFWRFRMNLFCQHLLFGADAAVAVIVSRKSFETLWHISQPCISSLILFTFSRDVIFVLKGFDMDFSRWHFEFSIYFIIIIGTDLHTCSDKYIKAPPQTHIPTWTFALSLSLSIQRAFGLCLSGISSISFINSGVS